MIGKHTLSVLACMLLCMLPATAQTQHLTNRQINENILFAPEHEAYRYGRKTDENGIAFSALEIDVVEKAVYRVAYGAYRNHDKTDSPRTLKIPYRFD